MVKTDVFYTLHTESNSTISAAFAESSPDRLNQITRGERATFTFRFSGESLVVQSGETYTVESGTTEIYETVDVKENGTLNVEEDGQLITTGGDNIEELQKYQDHAGSFATLDTLNNTQRFRNQIPSNIDISSLVLGVEPSPTLQSEDVPGIWGLVTSVTDNRTQALGDESVTVELQVLARYSEFADHTAINNNLEM